MDRRVKKILEQIKQLSINIFSDNLVGIYVHGSLALNCFNWDKSDLDFIVVLEDKPTQEQKEEYISKLLIINQHGPSKGLEMSIVLEKYTTQFIYPTPFELHFSNAHLKECTTNLKKYCQQMNGIDKDLAAHFTIINNTGFTLYGKQIKETFDEVPKADFLNSIKYDIEDAEKEIIANPIYIILNLCRVLAYINDHLILSKKDGGIWGIANIDKQYTNIINKALNSYLNSTVFDLEENKELLISFARYMLNLIYKN